MKRFGNLYKQICSIDNLKEAHKNAKKGKGWYKEVREVDEHLEEYLLKLQEMLVNHTYHTSSYVKFIKLENGKEREIYKLPYFPDRIAQWAIIQIIEPYLLKTLTPYTYSAIPKRGIHAALYDVEVAVRNDVPGCQYCYKFDVKKYYQSINHTILKQKFRRIFKDPELLWLLDEIIDSIETGLEPDTGIPIGNYISQYCGNLYLSSFDHWIKEVKGVKHVFRYMDDILIFGQTKEELHTLRNEVEAYFEQELKLHIKDNWQIFPTYIRGVDFVGYRVFLNYTLLRKETCKKFKCKMNSIQKKTKGGKLMSYSERCSVNSYKGWLKHCDSYRLHKKYITPIEPDTEKFYTTVIKRKAA